MRKIETMKEKFQKEEIQAKFEAEGHIMASYVTVLWVLFYKFNEIDLIFTLLRIKPK